MKNLHLLTIFVVYCLFSQVSLATENDFSKVSLKTTPVAGNIYMLEGVNGFAGGNMGVSVGRDGILLIDDQLAPMSEKIRESLKALGGGELRFILNTHWHSDHTGGNVNFAKDATIIAHANVRKRLMTTSTTMFSTVPPLPEEAWPVITFDESLTIHFNGEAISIFHHPKGHTDGDSVIYFPRSKVVHMGDHFFVGIFPFIDMENGGNVIGYSQNIANILKQLPDDVHLIPGHGPLATKKELQDFHEMLVTSITHVKQGIVSGLSLAEIQEKGLPAELDAWENGFIDADTWIGFVFQSIVAN